ncbi:polysaccharide deacetylase family protein [Paenibacillus thailandensis]|uniref:Polysaccharide deacetylase family protein n=1 Tax=Paenibacillus thailandensis TaxID=393250 RepID=A0ABW5QS36_9BACL
MKKLENRFRLLLTALFFAMSAVSGIGSPAAAAPAVPASEQQRNDMTWVRYKQTFPGHFVTNGARDAKKVALTFDDAPDPRFTPQILDILKEQHVRATFFIVGYRAEDHRELVRRIHREGHEIGNHSYNHPNYAELPLEQFQNQILRTDRAIRKIAGYSPRFIRPPYGELRSRQMRWLSEHDYTVVNWDVDSVDWRNTASSDVLMNIRKTLRPGSIVLQHAGGGDGQDLSGTIAALPALIEELKEQGFDIVPLSELLGQPAARRLK